VGFYCVDHSAVTPLKSLWAWSRFPRLVALLLSLCGRLRRSFKFKVRSALVSRTTGARSPPIRVRAGSLYSRSQLGVLGGACFGSGLGLKARRTLFSADRCSATLDALRRLLRDPMLILSASHPVRPHNRHGLWSPSGCDPVSAVKGVWSVGRSKRPGDRLA
jgi:hypothetical protein